MEADDRAVLIGSMVRRRRESAAMDFCGERGGHPVGTLNEVRCTQRSGPWAGHLSSFGVYFIKCRFEYQNHTFN